MNRQLLALLVVAILGVAGSAVLGAAPVMQLAADPRQLGPSDDFPGMWEYVYDVIGNATPYIVDCGLNGFDATLIANQWTYTYSPITGTLVQNWDWNAAHGGGGGAVGSYSYDGTTWTLHAEPWAIDNPWHAPGDYIKGASSMAVPGWYCPGVVSGESLMYTAKIAAGNKLTGLTKTFRIVHPNAPGTINYWIHSYYGPEEQGSGTILGPGSGPPPGDFDNDGDVDVDDINALCANMTGDGIPLPPGFEQYDLDNDGDADSADMDILIHDLVETTVGLGTEYGDFNLDGKIDTVDLTILGTYFGVGTSWSQGNANCDTTVDTVDLTILGTYFGFVASSPIPEPVTISLLGFGGLAMLRRKK